MDSHDLLDCLPPRDVDAEQALLGSVLLDPSVLADVPEVDAGDFYAHQNGRLWNALVEMHAAGRQIDPVLLCDRLKAAGQLEAIGGPAYIGEVAATVPYAANAAHYAAIVREKAAYRRVIVECREGMRLAYMEADTPTTLVNGILERLAAADAGTDAEQPTTVQDAALDALERIHSIRDGNATAGMLTGLPCVDATIGGLFGGELAILAARPGVGKTALACQIAWHFAEQGRWVYFASLEMQGREIMQRVLCGQAGVSSREVRTGRFGPDSIQQLIDASQPVHDFRWVFHAKMHLTVPELARWVQRTERRWPVSLIVLDYLQLLTPTGDKRANREQQVATMSRQLKSLAADTGAAVLCLAQLNRGLPTDRTPGLKMLRESGAIEQDADMVLVPWDYQWPAEKKLSAEEADEKLAEEAADRYGNHWHPRRKYLYCLKNRNGECGRFRLDWIPARTIFVDPGAGVAHSEFDEFS